VTLERWRQVEQIFEAVVAVPEPERADVMAELCGTDKALRNEVESLLAHTGAASAFLEKPAFVGTDVADDRPLVGHRFGSYLVRSLLGAGGMGEVYRAHDEQLGRDVAIKILPRLFANDAGRLARFDREARMLAALNHPHIGAIYGLEDVDGSPALVLELVEGETLAERIAKGPVSLAHALPIASQIANALQAAHKRGIIHRDLKPANIKITPDGVVKVLDFGLAKAAGATSTPDVTHAPAMARDGTRDGVVMGTAAYMSPEQARGEVVDKRTDIWAFGCVLYEMLTGHVPFKGGTVSDTIAAVLGREPEWDALPDRTPANIRLLLQRCLEKDPERRLGDLGDVRFEVAERDRRRRAVAAVFLLLAGGAGLSYLAKPATPVTSPAEYVQLTKFTDSATSPSLSPDGRMVTFKRGGDSFLGSGSIYVKRLPNGESVPLTTEGRVFGPVFTPDGSRIAYSQVVAGAWDTWTVPVLGGPPTRLLPNASGLTWIADRLVLFSEIKAGLHMGIVTATEARADSREIYIHPDEHAMAHYSYASPDRRSVLVVEMTGAHAFAQPCRLVPFDGSSSGHQVGPQGTCLSAAWSPDGHWMYFSAVVGGSSHLWRQRFPDGAPEQITFGPVEEEGIAVAPDGRSLVTSVGTRRSAIWIHDAAGERAIVSEGYASAPRLSRNGTHVFYLLVRDWWLSSRGWVASSADLRSLALASGKSDHVLSGMSVRDYEISRDEKEVAFTTTDDRGTSQIWLAPLDRRTPPREIARGGDHVSFGPDGELVFRSLVENNALVRIKTDGTGRERITTAPVLDKLSVSPQGQWVIALVPGGATIAIPIDGGVAKTICARRCYPSWSSDGGFLYVAFPEEGKTFAIPIQAGKSLPDLPAAGIRDAAAGAELRGARTIEHGSFGPGPDPSTYVFTKADPQRNLFRIPLH
jgi:serine/threonine protein kinase